MRLSEQSTDVQVQVQSHFFDDVDYARVVDRVAESCHTRGGRRALERIMRAPVRDADLLLRRADSIRALEAGAGKSCEIEAALTALTACEADARWCCIDFAAGEDEDTDDDSEYDEDSESMDEREDSPLSIEGEIERKKHGWGLQALLPSILASTGLSGATGVSDASAYLDTPYFQSRFLGFLNRFWPALWLNNVYSAILAPAVTLLSPLVYALIPFFVLRFKFGIPIGLFAYAKLIYHSVCAAGSMIAASSGRMTSRSMQLSSLVCSIIVYIQASLSALKQARAARRVCTRISERMNAMCDFVAAARSGARHADGALKAFGTSDGEGAFAQLSRMWLPSKGHAHDAGDAAALAPFKAFGAITPFKCGFAKALTAYRALDRAALRRLMRGAYLLDAVHAAARARARLGLRWARYADRRDSGDGPLFAARQLRPLLGGAYDKAGEETKANDVVLREDNKAIILSGANASGKSTLLRSIATAALTAQTLGMGPAEELVLRPFDYLCSMINISDDPARGLSRFQNELMRAGECMDYCLGKPDEKTECGLVLMDEIFGGTDAVQADVCGTRVLSALAGAPGCALVLCSHHPVLLDAGARLPGARALRMTAGYGLAEGRVADEEKNAVALMDAALGPRPRNRAKTSEPSAKTSEPSVKTSEPRAKGGIKGGIKARFSHERVSRAPTAADATAILEAEPGLLMDSLVKCPATESVLEATAHATEADLEATAHATEADLEATAHATESDLEATAHATEADLEATEADLEATEADLEATEADLEATAHATEADLEATAPDDHWVINRARGQPGATAANRGRGRPRGRGRRQGRR